MHANKIALAIATLILGTRAGFQLENEDVPDACKAICKPIMTLTDICEIDQSGSNNSDGKKNRLNNSLEAQCICTNDSFDVDNIAALCADCIRQNWRKMEDNDGGDDLDDDDYAPLDELNDILYTCGWTTASYAPASSTAADGITVDATALTVLSQLTTTIVPGSSRSDSAGTATVNASASGTAGSSSSDSSSSGSNSNSVATATNSVEQANETDNAALALAPIGVAGVAVAGAFLMLV
ncbi:hypothetical protein G7Z17_g838 [Cylindrodendrum hubeiense]|uniref:Protein CAP22 n=1 Tax=Cylindrodendrum hubeiense TaxID=595255 RepID=A0A9P5HMR4_9HYPO|nr:hypothetical protein G7Z17_g838 [Cylindrodendrum hubeiense]